VNDNPNHSDDETVAIVRLGISEANKPTPSVKPDDGPRNILVIRRELEPQKPRWRTNPVTRGEPPQT
jgi:hypothetical protein